MARAFGDDPERIETIMTRSVWASGRERKWESKRGAKSYLEVTIAAAIRHVRARGLKPYAPTSVAPAPDREPLTVDTLADLAADPALMTVPRPLSRWLIWNGELTVLVGREKFGKSTLVTDDAIAAIEGSHKVLWVTAEESRNLIVKRFADRRCRSDGVLVPTRWPQSWAEVEAIIAERKPGAVYVDSLASFLMAVDGRVPETSEGERWHALVLRFKGWTAIGAGGVCVLLHATKADGSYRGSTGIGAAPDTIITMRPGGTTFVQGLVPFGGRWFLYYGTADSRVAVAVWDPAGRHEMRGGPEARRHRRLPHGNANATPPAGGGRGEACEDASLAIRGGESAGRMAETADSVTGTASRMTRAASSMAKAAIPAAGHASSVGGTAARAAESVAPATKSANHVKDEADSSPREGCFEAGPMGAVVPEEGSPRLPAANGRRRHLSRPARSLGPVPAGTACVP